MSFAFSSNGSMILPSVAVYVIVPAMLGNVSVDVLNVADDAVDGPIDAVF